MKWIKSILLTLATTFLGMFGGQKNKAARRFGIPGIALISGGISTRALPLLLLIPTLVMGYGESSWLRQTLGGSDILTRLVYGLLLSLPFLFYGLKRFLAAVILLIIAFQIRAGSLGHIGSFDILIEDIARYSLLGILISFNLFFRT